MISAFIIFGTDIVVAAIDDPQDSNHWVVVVDNWCTNSCERKPFAAIYSEHTRAPDCKLLLTRTDFLRSSDGSHIDIGMCFRLINLDPLGGGRLVLSAHRKATTAKHCCQWETFPFYRRFTELVIETWRARWESAACSPFQQLQCETKRKDVSNAG